MAESPANGGTPLGEPLRRLLRAIVASGRAVLPSSNDELLETIVEAAARLFGAAAASIALVDDKAQRIVFRVAYGAGRDQVIGLSIPVDEGIAGYVVTTGQPMAISNVQQDPRFARDAAEKTGYVPRSILAMPLFRHDRVIGVMEVLDKINAPAFGMEDMELLALFARQAAIAIDQSQQYERLNGTLLRGLRQLASQEDPAAAELLGALDDAGLDLPARALDEIADRLNAISALGEAEQAACLQILTAFADYARAKNRMGGI